MLVNKTNSRIVVGRFTILPGEKVPALPMTDKEARGIEKLKARGFLIEKPNVHKSEAVPQKVVKEKVEAAKPEQKLVPKSENKPENKTENKSE